MSEEHAKYAPSASPIWMYCGGSTTIDVSDVDDSDQHSNRGTRLHALASDWLEHDLASPDHELETPDDAASVQQYVEYVQSLPGKKFYEKRTEWIPKCGGTTDCAVISPDGLTLHVIDYKAGFVIHSPVMNTQLMIYALGIMKWLAPIYTFERVRLTICQPMHWADGDEPPSWEVPAGKILTEGEVIRATVEALERGELTTFAPRKDRCRFCTVGRAMRCPALDAQAKAAADADWDEWAAAKEDRPQPGSKWALTPVSEMTDLERYEMADTVTLWAKRVKEAVTSKVLMGTPVDGFKTVAGKRRRVVNDRAGLVAHLGAEGFGEDKIFTGEPKLVSPNQAEKLFKGKGSGAKKTALAQFFHTEEGANVVVPEYDNRPTVSPTASADRDFAGYNRQEEED